MLVFMFLLLIQVMDGITKNWSITMVPLLLPLPDLRIRVMNNIKKSPVAKSDPKTTLSKQRSNSIPTTVRSTMRTLRQCSTHRSRLLDVTKTRAILNHRNRETRATIIQMMMTRHCLKELLRRCSNHKEKTRARRDQKTRLWLDLMRNTSLKLW